MKKWDEGLKVEVVFFCGQSHALPAGAKVTLVWKSDSGLSKKDQKQFHLFRSHLCYKSNLQFEAKLIKGWFHLFWSHLFCLSLHLLQSGPLFPHLQTRRQIRHRDIFENQIRGDCSIHSTNILMFIVMPPKGYISKIQRSMGQEAIVQWAG